MFERQADRCAVELTGNIEALASALTKLAELNFVTKKWGKWDIFQSHPDMERRIEYIRQQVATVSTAPCRITEPTSKDALPPVAAI
jgi:Zn-dependent protease with chaperone function